MVGILFLFLFAGEVDMEMVAWGVEKWELSDLVDNPAARGTALVSGPWRIELHQFDDVYTLAWTNRLHFRQREVFARVIEDVIRGREDDATNKQSVIPPPNLQISVIRRKLNHYEEEIIALDEADIFSVHGPSLARRLTIWLWGEGVVSMYIRLADLEEVEFWRVFHLWTQTPAVGNRSPKMGITTSVRSPLPQSVLGLIDVTLPKLDETVPDFRRREFLLNLLHDLGIEMVGNE